MSDITKYANGRKYTCRPWRGGVFYIFWSEDGRSKRQSTGTTSVYEAQAFLDEFVTAEVDAPRVMTCEDLFRLKYPEGENERADAAWKHLAPAFGSLRPVEVTDALEARYIAGRTAARSTIRAELTYLRAGWNHAVQKRILPSTELPVLGPLPAGSPPRARWLTVEEMKRLRAAADAEGGRVRLFIWIALEAPARRTAIQDLRWDQVDWETGVIHFLPEGEAQSRKRRPSVPISRALLPVLEAAYAERSPTDPYVIGAGGRVNSGVARVAAAAGLKGVTPHVLRHTAATHMARRGTPLFHIAKVLGNTVEQVEKVYAKHSPEWLRGAVDSISGD